MYLVADFAEILSVCEPQATSSAYKSDSSSLFSSSQQYVKTLEEEITTLRAR